MSDKMGGGNETKKIPEEIKKNIALIEKTIKQLSSEILKGNLGEYTIYSISKEYKDVKGNYKTLIKGMEEKKFKLETELAELEK